MQEDFCGQDGYLAKMGYPIDLTRAPIPFIQNLLSLGRKKGMHIIHTREGHRDNFVDLAENKRWRSERVQAGIGSNSDEFLKRGSRGWQIIPECSPNEGETIIDKCGKGGFYATDLEHILRLRKIQNLILAGVTTDVAVHTTMREANDRGDFCFFLHFYFFYLFLFQISQVLNVCWLKTLVVQDQKLTIDLLLQ
jgi:biuret amidohydrolase